MAALAVNGTQIEVPHMHFFRYDAEGRVTDLWHVWNTLALARQRARQRRRAGAVT